MRISVGVLLSVLLAVASVLPSAACASRTLEAPLDASATAPLPTEPDDAASGAWVAPDAASDEACQQSSGVECERCCYAAHPTAKETFFQAFRACVCRKPQPSCAKECSAAFCGEAFTADDAQKRKGCFTCLTRSMDGENADCETTADSACVADGECKATSKCVAACPAAANPASDAGRD